jgi:tRNA A37 threonylcarbamoyladenosine dehydratase
VDARRAFINNETYEELLDPGIDLLIDAIDSVNAKVGLLEATLGRGIPVVSSMGCGGRLDGSLIRVADLSETNNCPLARVVRLRLGRRGIRRGIRCVYSPEPCRNERPYDPQDVDAHLVPSRPRAPLGTISYMPALFGLRVAEEAIRILLSENALRNQG